MHSYIQIFIKCIWNFSHVVPDADESAMGEYCALVRSYSAKMRNHEGNTNLPTCALDLSDTVKSRCRPRIRT